MQPARDSADAFLCRSPATSFGARSGLFEPRIDGLAASVRIAAFSFQ